MRLTPNDVQSPISLNRASFLRPLFSGPEQSELSYLSRVRIGITGAQGVGKTSLAQALSQKLDLPLIEEVARTVFELGFPLGPESNALSQVAIWFGQFNVETRLGSFVADRTLLDVAIHCALLCERSQDPRDIYITNAVISSTACTLRDRYDVIFYVPIEFPLQGDGVRSTSTDFQRILDERTIEMLGHYGIPAIKLQGSLERRLQTALSVVSDFEANRRKKSISA